MKFAIVVVLYQKKIQQLPFFSWLGEIFASEIPIYCYDNSPIAQDFPTSPWFIYQHDPRNLGVTAGYNFAYQQLQGKDYDGLLLLDQDTQLSLAYLKELQQLVIAPNVFAVVPKIFAGSQQISPVKSADYINRNAQALTSGCYAQEVMAINSGSLLRFSFLTKIGGFNLEFPLDFSDHWLFYALHKQQGEVLVLDTKLEHQLSVLDYTTMSHGRYQQILAAEKLFYTRYRRDLLRTHCWQLFKRSAKQLVKVRDLYFAKTTFFAGLTLLWGGTK